MVIIGWLFTAFMTDRYTKLNGIFDETFYVYISPIVVLMTISSFILLSNTLVINSLKKQHFIYTLIQMLSKTSFGIYLVHVAVLDLVGRGVLNNLFDLPINFNVSTFHPTIGIPLLATTVLSISTLIVKIFQRLPLFKFLLPN